MAKEFFEDSDIPGQLPHLPPRGGTVPLKNPEDNEPDAGEQADELDETPDRNRLYPLHPGER